MGYFECSAKTGEGVDDIFYSVARFILKSKKKPERWDRSLRRLFL